RAPRPRAGGGDLGVSGGHDEDRGPARAPASGGALTVNRTPRTRDHAHDTISLAHDRRARGSRRGQVPMTPVRALLAAALVLGGLAGISRADAPTAPAAPEVHRRPAIPDVELIDQAGRPVHF